MNNSNRIIVFLVQIGEMTAPNVSYLKKTLLYLGLCAIIMVCSQQ